MIMFAQNHIIQFFAFYFLLHYTVVSNKYAALETLLFYAQENVKKLVK